MESFKFELNSEVGQKNSSSRDWLLGISSLMIKACYLQYNLTTIKRTERGQIGT